MTALRRILLPVTWRCGENDDEGLTAPFGDVPQLTVPPIYTRALQSIAVSRDEPTRDKRYFEAVLHDDIVELLYQGHPALIPACALFELVQRPRQIRRCTRGRCCRLPSCYRASGCGSIAGRKGTAEDRRPIRWCTSAHPRRTFGMKPLCPRSGLRRRIRWRHAV